MMHAALAAERLGDVHRERAAADRLGADHQAAQHRRVAADEPREHVALIGHADAEERCWPWPYLIGKILSA